MSAPWRGRSTHRGPCPDHVLVGIGIGWGAAAAGPSSPGQTQRQRIWGIFNRRSHATLAVSRGVAMTPTIQPLIAAGVMLATAATDAVYVMFTSAVVARRRVPAASWSSVWYLLSSFAVISYTQNWIYVIFAAAGSWLGAFVSITFLQRSAGRPPGGPHAGIGPALPVGRDRHFDLIDSPRVVDGDREQPTGEEHPDHDETQRVEVAVKRPKRRPRTRLPVGVCLRSIQAPLRRR